MTDIAVALRELSEPWERGDKIKAAIARAARAAGFSYTRTFDLWYGKARRVEAEELERVAAALAKKRTEAARNEVQELRLRLTRLESILAQIDPDFHRASIGAVGDQLREMGGADRPLARSGHRPTIGGRLR